MKIQLHGETELSISQFGSDGVEIVADSPLLHYGPHPMFIGALGWCTAKVLISYGERIQADTAELSVRLKWGYAEKPYRIGQVDMQIRWPALPESRLDAATRAAAFCTIHNTLKEGVEVDTLVER
jgi:uncharacterized OsmC-like protein